jgi:tripartite-type tricarboxylate transporter receptor subunit TctC
MASISPHYKSGALRPLAFYSKERMKDFPNVPTMAELGYHVRPFNWYGFMAPRGTPEEVLRAINMACKKAAEEHKEFITSRLEALSMKLSYLGPEDFGKLLKEDDEAMRKIYKELSKVTPGK